MRSTRVLLRISRFRRSMTLLVWISSQYLDGKSIYVSVSSSLSLLLSASYSEVPRRQPPFSGQPLCFPAHESPYGEARRISEPARTVEPKKGNTPRISQLFKDRSGCNLHADERGSHEEWAVQTGVQSAAWRRGRVYSHGRTVF